METSIISFFAAPISNKRPASHCSIASLHQYITSNERLKAATEAVRACIGNREAYRKKKLALLPYVSPAGTFSYCNREGLICPSGDYVVDIDGLASEEEACRLRDEIIADPRLRPDLAYVSPSGKGVKIFVPYRIDPDRPLAEVFSEALECGWSYIEAIYGVEVDRANSDLCRGCLVCHDADAKLRATNVVDSQQVNKKNR